MFIDATRLAWSPNMRMHTYDKYVFASLDIAGRMITGM